MGPWIRRTDPSNRAASGCTVAGAVAGEEGAGPSVDTERGDAEGDEDSFGPAAPAQADSERIKETIRPSERDVPIMLLSTPSLGAWFPYG